MTKTLLGSHSQPFDELTFIPNDFQPVFCWCFSCQVRKNYTDFIWEVTLDCNVFESNQVTLAFNVSIAMYWGDPRLQCLWIKSGALEEQGQCPGWRVPGEGLHFSNILLLYICNKVVANVRAGYTGMDPGVRLWTFPSALMYSLTVFTTIGRFSSSWFSGEQNTFFQWCVVH